ALGVLVHEVEVRLKAGSYPLSIALGGAEGPAHVLMQHSQVRIDQGQVEVLLRREVVVQDRLGDAGLLGHGLHGHRVEAGVAEHAASDVQQLSPAFRGPHPPPRGLRWRLRGLASTHLGYYYRRVTYR